MREKAIWAVLHKSWEESMKHERLLKTLLMNISGEQLWSASELELKHQFPDVPAEVWKCFVKRRTQTDLSKVESYLIENHIDVFCILCRIIRQHCVTFTSRLLFYTAKGSCLAQI